MHVHVTNRKPTKIYLREGGNIGNLNSNQGPVKPGVPEGRGEGKIQVNNPKRPQPRGMVETNGLLMIFEGSGGPRWEEDSIKNRSEREVNMGMQPGIDF